ncbi:28S ribosomal protein S9, mitochondrial-like isoform X2 [Xenia sp. Carnegie-2017]|uniref:28S ribosomal protein S9, mitochondrial-like isoform X2 n=1 Tax=Xenia sp. Carnegie-2017 TaxID=2897299 RepID=UPI001F03BA19|nr:28S ribosomal protein S9, mitochondrial-like isoform X2 [Xenia sp. Carnegie-2017]
MVVNLGARTRNYLRFINTSLYGWRDGKKAFKKNFRNFKTHSCQQQRRTKLVEDQSNVEFMAEEVKKYEMGKRWLAKMMGVDVETFTDNDVQESLQYLLPTKLFAKDARPVMKHPTELFPGSKSNLDENDRPLHAAFYTGSIAFHDLIYDISRHRRPRESASNKDSEEVDVKSEDDQGDDTKSKDTRKMRWLTHLEMQAVLKEELALKDYNVLIHRLKKLTDDKKLDNSEEINKFLKRFKTPVVDEASQFHTEKLDEDGRAHGRGYRKRAMAEVWISNGTGEVVINDVPIIEYFPKQEDRNQVWHPFIALRCMGKYDAECNVIGGGTTGQAGAIRLALSRALTSMTQDYFSQLQTAGLLTRDKRLVERKKPGQKKARKKFAWVKR